MRQKNKPKRRSPRSVLRLPDLDHSKSSVLQSLGSVASQRTYGFAIDDFISWYCSEPRLAFGRTVVLRYRYYLESRQLAPATINLRLAAVRRLAYEASDNGLLSPDLAAGIRRVKGAKRLGIRLGNWLTSAQGRELLGVPDRTSVKGKRNYAMLAVLLGCGLRRSELTRLTVSHLQQRDGHWAIVDLFGKGGHVRTVPVPAWVKVAIDSWLAIAGIDTGIIFRCVSRTGHVWGNRLSEKAVWWVVREYAKLAGIDNLAPHDLRRTCARLCHSAGGELEQIQFLLGHRSVETTERYLGSRQRLVQAVNDHLGIEPPGGSEVTFPAYPEVFPLACTATKRPKGDTRMAGAMQKLESAESDRMRAGDPEVANSPDSAAQNVIPMYELKLNLSDLNHAAASGCGLTHCR